MKINELILKEDDQLSEKQKEFLETHSNILTAGSVISNGLISLAQNLKKMRDEKLYIEAGFETFEIYSETACGLKQRQAYNYIKILEDLGEDFLHSNAKIGVSKLTLLSTLSEEERIEVLDNVNIEETSVNELKDEIAKLKEELSVKNDDIESEKLKSEEQIKQLKMELEDLKNKSVEKEIVQDPTLKEKIDSLENQLKMSKNRLSFEEKRVEELTKKCEINNSTALLEFKLKFEDLQNLALAIKSLIPSLPAEKQEGCKLALKKVGESLC